MVTVSSVAAPSRSDKAGHPQWVVLGIGQIIKGLDIGMVDMCPGEKRKITVPPALAFGESGKGESGRKRLNQLVITSDAAAPPLSPEEEVMATALNLANC